MPKMSIFGPDAHTDEARVPDYTLPDPLTRDDGSRVSAADWPARREEILRVFRDEMYGSAPARPTNLRWEVREEGDAFAGAARRRQVRIYFSNAREPYVDLLLYAPKGAGKALPCFLAMNFAGNHSVTDDPAVFVTENHVLAKHPGVVNNRATEASRGTRASSYVVQDVVARGYAFATIYLADIDPDFYDDFQNGVHSLDTRPRDEHSWGTIAAWAWGFSCTLDYLEHELSVDERRVAVIGHSRLGKTALWAGAQDERFAMVISNNSGSCGAAIGRRKFGERFSATNRERNRHWFCSRFHSYNDKEDQLPVDQHELLALIAPRPVYVASASEDKWADPRGEYLACVHADPVYRLLGTEGFPGGADDMPAPGGHLHGRIGYHLRQGPHAMTSFDWQRYLDFADRHLSP